MCNFCVCENQDLCSKVGYMSPGMCCPKCLFYRENEPCSRSGIRKQINVSAKQFPERGLPAQADVKELHL